MFVTVELLDKLNACKAERNRFAELFPEGVELTRELIIKHAEEFNWSWFAENLASVAGLAVYLRAQRSARPAYQQAMSAHQQVVAKGTNAYQQAMSAHRQVVAKGTNAYQQAMSARRQVVANGTNAYHQAEMPARAAYNLARATAFADVMGL